MGGEWYAPSWYITWGSVLAPMVFSALVIMMLTITWKRINRSEGNKSLSKKNIFIITMFSGFILGGFFQWALSEITYAVTRIDTDIKLVVLAALFTGPLSMIIYDGLRWQAKRKGWTNLYEYLTVRHSVNVDYTDDEYNDGGDFTVKNFKPIKKSKLRTEQQKRSKM
jgi:hypothetical protein